MFAHFQPMFGKSEQCRMQPFSSKERMPLLHFASHLMMIVSIFEIYLMIISILRFIWWLYLFDDAIYLLLRYIWWWYLPLRYIWLWSRFIWWWYPCLIYIWWWCPSLLPEHPNFRDLAAAAKISTWIAFSSSWMKYICHVCNIFDDNVDDYVEIYEIHIWENICLKMIYTPLQDMVISIKDFERETMKAFLRKAH